MDSGDGGAKDSGDVSEQSWQHVEMPHTLHLFGDPNALPDLSEFIKPLSSEPGSLPSVDVERFNFGDLQSEQSGIHERSVDRSICPSPSSPIADASSVVFDSQSFLEPVVSDSQWMLGVAAGHAQFSQVSAQLRLPWETGVFAEIFGTGSLLELPCSHLPEPDSELMERVISVAESLDQTSALPSGSCYDKAVRNIRIWSTLRIRIDSWNLHVDSGLSCCPAIGMHPE